MTVLAEHVLDIFFCEKVEKLSLVLVISQEAPPVCGVLLVHVTLLLTPLPRLDLAPDWIVYMHQRQCQFSYTCHNRIPPWEGCLPWHSHQNVFDLRGGTVFTSAEPSMMIASASGSLSDIVTSASSISPS